LGYDSVATNSCCECVVVKSWCDMMWSKLYGSFDVVTEYSVVIKLLYK
jgi:hypothetical protein